MPLAKLPLALSYYVSALENPNSLGIENWYSFLLGMFQQEVGEGGWPQWFPSFLRVYQEDSIWWCHSTLDSERKSTPRSLFVPWVGCNSHQPSSSHCCLLSLLGSHAPVDITLRQPCLSPHTLNPGHRGQDWGWHVTQRQGICRPTSNPWRGPVW